MKWSHLSWSPRFHIQTQRIVCNICSMTIRYTFWIIFWIFNWISWSIKIKKCFYCQKEELNNLEWWLALQHKYCTQLLRDAIDSTFNKIPIENQGIIFYTKIIIEVNLKVTKRVKTELDNYNVKLGETVLLIISGDNVTMA